MDMELIAKAGREASRRCVADAKKIDSGLPKCFRTNPGGTLTEERKQRLEEILDVVELRNHMRS